MNISTSAKVGFGVAAIVAGGATALGALSLPKDDPGFGKHTAFSMASMLGGLGFSLFLFKTRQLSAPHHPAMSAALMGAGLATMTVPLLTASAMSIPAMIHNY